MKKRIITVFTFLVCTLYFVISSCHFTSNAVQLDVSAKPYENLSDYHFFTDKPSLFKPNKGVLPYDLNSALFTDYAHKSRFLFVPEGKKVSYQEETALNLPVGSCYIKNFYYPADFRKPKENIRIMETRLLVHRESGWEAVEYIWNDDQSDAKLENAGAIKKASWIHYDGSKMETDYIFPNKNQCQGCHRLSNQFMPIGPKVRNLNKDFAYADGQKNQLTKMKEAGILEGLPNDISSCPKMVAFENKEEPLEKRARAYLDINCGHCHNPKGPAYTSGLYLNLENNAMQNLGVCKSPVAAGKATGGNLYDIAPHDPEHSILLYRMQSTDPSIKMPELGKSLVHKEGVALIKEWIAQIEGNCK